MTDELIVKLASGAEAADVARRAGLALTPLHPGTEDPELAMYFTAQVAPHDREDVTERLMRIDGVDGAYRKPPGSPP